MITELITNVAIMAALVVVATEYLSKLTKVEGLWAQIQSWVVAVLLFLLVLVPCVHAAESYEYVTQWGSLDRSRFTPREICTWEWIGRRPS